MSSYARLEARQVPHSGHTGRVQTCGRIRGGLRQDRRRGRPASVGDQRRRPEHAPSRPRVRQEGGRWTLSTRPATANGNSMRDWSGRDAGVARMTPVFAIDPVISVVVSAARDLDDATAARLLHWCEGRLHLLDTGRSVISHLLVDLSHARRATPSAVAILDHARVEADLRHVGIHLVGAGPIMATCSLLPLPPQSVECLSHPRRRVCHTASTSRFKSYDTSCCRS